MHGSILRGVIPCRRHTHKRLCTRPVSTVRQRALRLMVLASGSMVVIDQTMVLILSRLMGPLFCTQMQVALSRLPDNFWVGLLDSAWENIL